MKKAIIIGASSGIGMELAKILSKENYIVGLAARRVNLLKKLQQELPNLSFVKYIDISKLDEIEKNINELIIELEGIDLLIISSGIGHLNEELDWQKEKETIDVNVLGFTKTLNIAVKYFLKKGKGHIVGISSIGALRGDPVAPAYDASKAFISNYMEGIRSKIKKAKLQIYITDIKPGFVDTDMAKGEGLFWVMPPTIAARQIFSVIKKKRDKAYITKRWAIIAIFLKYMPDWMFYKL
ncbi:MAG: SDR family NAD(P)-dependent oxidoreductase [Spirochaetes bacterium]|jgi:short-subunit dehydrogenase|nr:SDR family NAD(P)-dependent oxidoreductase [Spirochaetota bacterium]